MDHILAKEYSRVPSKNRLKILIEYIKKSNNGSLVTICSEITQMLVLDLWLLILGYNVTINHICKWMVFFVFLLKYISVPVLSFFYFTEGSNELNQYF